MFGVKKKEDAFYKMFIEFSGKIITAGEAFVDLVRNYDDKENKIANIKVIETECDMEAHKILQALHSSFLTPFDREDMYNITKEMDNIVDCLEEVANRFLVFGVEVMKPEAVEMADLTLQAIRELDVTFKHLEEMKRSTIVKDQIIEINRLENEGDVVFRQSLGQLFKTEKDPIELVKWKHLLEQLEESLDSCENVANILEGVTIKYA